MTSEIELIECARHFDMTALAEIYDHYSPGIFRYAMHLLGDPQQAEDCTADTFMRYLQTLRNGGGPQEHLQGYLYRTAHNWAADVYRRNPLPPLQLYDDVPGLEDDPGDAAIERIEKEQVRAALVRLTPEQRQVIVLKYLEGWDNEMVAQILEKPVGSVKSLQHRAIDALRRWLLPKKEETYDSNGRS